MVSGRWLVQRLLQPLGGVLCKPALAFSAPFHSQWHQQLQTRLLQLFRPALTYYRFTQVHSQLSAFSAVAVQVFAVPFPLSHTKAKAQRIHFFGLRFILSSRPVHIVIVSGRHGLSSAVEQHCRILWGQENPSRGGSEPPPGLHWCYIRKWRTNARIHFCSESWEISGTSPSSSLAVASWWQKSWRQQSWGFFSFQLFHIRNNSLPPVYQNLS